MASTKKTYSEARHLVVDIETLGVAVPAPILSIGMAMLDCSAGFPVTLTVHSIQVNPARCVGSPGTASALWWMKQSEAARRAALAPEKSGDPWEEFLSLVESFSPDYFWGKSPDFDFGHMEAQLKHAGHAVPWPFWRLRDIRTMEGLGLSFSGEDPVLDAKESAWLPEALCTEHVAVFDALCEARGLYSTIRALSALSSPDVLARQ